MKKLTPATKRYAALAALAFGLVGVLGAATPPTDSADRAAATASHRSEAQLLAALSCPRADENACR